MLIVEQFLCSLALSVNPLFSHPSETDPRARDRTSWMYSNTKMLSPATSRTVQGTTSSGRKSDLARIGKSEVHLTTLLVDNGIPEKEVLPYLDNLPTKEWQRLLSLLCDDKAIPFTFDEAFQEFLLHSPTWAVVSDRTLLFDSYPHHENMRVLRRPTTHICSAHAVVVLVHLERCIRADPAEDIFMPAVRPVASSI